MSAQVVCFASPKGGSGKTVLTATCGAFLAALGKRVLLVDTDAATNGLTLLYLREAMDRRDGVVSSVPAAGLYDLTPDIGATIVALPTGADLVPATFQLHNTEDLPPDAFASKLLHVLEGARSEYDFILLDAQAGSDPMARISMSREMSDAVVIVSEYDPLSAAGVERLKGLFPQDLSYERTWILLNKMLPEFVRSFSDFLEVARYLSPIPWDADVVRAYSRRQLALDLEHGNDYTLAITRMLQVLLGPQMAEEIDAWLRARASQLREPVVSQIQDMELELEGLFVDRAKRLQAMRRQRVRLAIFTGYLVIGLALGAVFLFRDIVGLTNALIIGSALAALVTAVSNLALGLRADPPEAELENRRLLRREEVIEERLRHLRSLASAEPDELLRARKP